MAKKVICDFCKTEVESPRLTGPQDWASIKCSSYGFAQYAVSWQYDVCPECKDKKFGEVAKGDQADTMDSIFRELVEECVGEAMDNAQC